MLEAKNEVESVLRINSETEERLLFGEIKDEKEIELLKLNYKIN